MTPFTVNSIDTLEIIVKTLQEHQYYSPTLLCSQSFYNNVIKPSLKEETTKRVNVSDITKPQIEVVINQEIPDNCAALYVGEEPCLLKFE